MTPTKPKSAIPLQRQHEPKRRKLETLLLETFGYAPYYAMAKQTKGETSYHPVKKPLAEDIIKSHLKGEITLGTYHLDPSSMVRWLGWDVDSTNRATAKEFATKILSRLERVPHTVEFSGSKGYHILIFLDQPISAKQAKHITDFVRDAESLPKTGPSHVECYPKQEQLTKSNPMGSLLKLPLGLHPKTHDRSRFIDPLNGWEKGEDLDALDTLSNKATLEEVLGLIKENVDVHHQLVELLVPAWVGAAGEHHNFALYLAGYLAHIGWGLQEAEELVHQIATKAGDAEVHNRVHAVKDTFKNVAQGRTVKGFSGLSDMLPGVTIKALADLATQVVTPTLVKRIDAMRLQKGPLFEKIRSSANVIWADLAENGDVVQTSDHTTYWFSEEDKHLIPFESIVWRATLHKQYGLNPTDSFGKQTSEEIRLKAISEARVVEVRNRTFWDGKCLFVNLGNSLVFKLDGSTIETTYNGECGHLFKTDPNLKESIVPDWDNPIDVWGHLVEDISFSKSADAPAKPPEQKELLKAWILAFFFQEIMPTKPLLLAMGAPGSGKTSAIRRILKILESPTAEVLEIAGDKPDSLRSSIMSHRLLALDNLEKSGVKWLVDTLNRLATGANIELRQLYKTNETYVIKPECFVAMTAVAMPFSEESLFSRILPLEMAQLDDPVPEYILQKQLLDNQQGIWADLLLKLNDVVKALIQNTDQPPPIASRLADFTVFCRQIENVPSMNGQMLIKGLRSLVDRQKLALLDSSPFVSALEEWIASDAEEANKYHTFGDIFAILEPIARQRKLSWRWSNAIALSRHILALAEPLKKLYRADFKEDKDNNNKPITLLKFNTT